MGVNEIIVYIMVVFMALGALDRAIGNKFVLGEKFEEGFMALGSLALAMVGVISLAPVLAKLLQPVVVPLYTFLGADPSMFAATLLANDMGGYQLSQELAINADAGRFAGVIVASMLGATVVFTIPVSLGIIRAEDRKFLATGVLAGIISIPVGSLVGGLVAGFSFPLIIRNLIPIIIFAALIAIGLWKAPDAMVKGFAGFGKGVVFVITIGLAAAVIEALTGFVVIPGMAPIEEGIATIGSIALVLAGAFPLVYVLTKVLKKPLMKLGGVLGMNDVAAAGLVATLANDIPMFDMMKDMDDRGKIINVAFAVSAAFVFGDHLGFTAGVAKDMILPMIVGKLAGGVVGIILAMFIANAMGYRRNKAEEKA